MLSKTSSQQVGALRPQRAGFKWLAVLISLLGALGVAEFLVRALVPDPAFRLENRIDMWQADPAIGYRNKPNFSGYSQFVVPVKTNSLGFRGAEVAVVKPPGTFRILGLGDSVTWGVGLRDESVFLRLLGQKLEASSERPDVRIETVNAGVSGYSTYQALLTLQRDGLRLCPDLVFVGFVHNDFYPSEDPFHNIESFHQPRKMQTRRRAYPPASSGLRPSLFDFLRANYVLTMERFRRDRLRPSEPLEQVLAAEPVTEFDRDARPIVADQFRLFQALADKNGFHLIVLLFPIYPAVTSLADSPFPQNWLRGVLTAEGIDHLDLFETFRTRPDQRFMDWRHYTAEGNVVIADAIVRHLSSRRMLPGRDRGPLTECRADL